MTSRSEAARGPQAETARAEREDGSGTHGTCCQYSQWRRSLKLGDGSLEWLPLVVISYQNDEYNLQPK